MSPVQVLLLALLGPVLGYGLALLPGAARYLSALVPAALLVAFAGHLEVVAGGQVVMGTMSWAPSLGVEMRLALDGFSLLFALLITGIGTLVTVYANAYFADAPKWGRARFVCLILVFMAAMLGTVLSDDLIAMFVFWEATSITSFLLIGFEAAKAEARRAAAQSLIVTSGGGLALFGAILLIGRELGTSSLSEVVARADVLAASPTLPAIVVLLLAGTFTKSAQFPFHFWLPRAMAAPTPASAYLHSATMVKLGVYLLARLDLAFAGVPAFGTCLVVFGLATMVIAALNALRSAGWKAVLAHSTVASLGILVLLIGLDGPAADVAVVSFVVAHALYKATLFFCAGTAIHATDATDFRRLGGLARFLPLTAAGGVLASLSMAGLPPFFGFIAKESAFEAQLGSTYGVLPVVLAVVTNAVMVAIAAVVTLGPFFGGRGRVERVHHGDRAGLVAGPLTLGLLGALFGLAAGPVGDALVLPAASALRGSPVDTGLSLWHGPTPMLALSALVVALGLFVAWRWDPLRDALDRSARARWMDADRTYHASVEGVLRLARTTTAWLQNGDQRRYTLVVSLSLVTVACLSIVRTGGLALTPSGGPVLALPTALLALALVGALVAARTRSLIVGLLGVGVFGYVSALLYLLNGAPDLALTQFAVETLVLVVLTAVLLRLPTLASGTRTRRERSVDAGVATVFAAVLFVGLSSMTAQDLDLKLSEFYAAASYLQAFGQNVVNVIIVDFRGLDTLGEISVVGFATLAAWVLLRRRPRK